MNKNKVLEQLCNILVKVLRHRIGSIVNPDEDYTTKYRKEAFIFFQQAELVNKKLHWNRKDKQRIKEILKKKLEEELHEKEFLHQQKFEIMDTEIEAILKRLKLN